VAKKELEFSDILCAGIRPEMRERLNRLNRDNALASRRPASLSVICWTFR
jgi:hypothetical protein